MSENPLKHEPTGNAGFERQDLGAKGVLWFLAGLALFLLIVHFILTGAYGWMDRYAAKQQPPQNPLAPPAPADTRTVLPADANKFPEPRLETAETTELRGVRQREENTLNSYGWVDEKAGVARIPIDRAMQLIAQRGLPTRPANGTSLTKPTGTADVVKERGRLKPR